MKNAILGMCIMGVTGCTTTSQWGETQTGAVYSFERTADGGCTITITSGREVQGSADMAIDGSDCSLAVKADDLGSGADAGYRVMEKLLDKVVP